KVLCENRWMYKKEDKWHLTKEGRMVGGEVKYNPKCGEYIVWPVNLDINEKVTYDEALSATSIGEEFGISPQKINLQLNELV
ncbi:MAG: hypothetical protein ACOC11_01755, partial [Prolixibacteraceae bacterium]